MSDTTADSPPLNVTDMPKVGIAWGDDISEERKRDLEALLAAWDTETDHGDRIGPFDVTGLSEGKSDRLRLTGADVFYLAARAQVGARPKIIVSPKIKPILDLDAAFAALHDPDMSYYCDLSYVNLGGADLQEIQLAHAYLLGANLTATDLYGANLERANLAWIQLEGAELLLARLERAELTEARLKGAMFVGAVLKNATLQFAHLTDADLSEADFEGADLHGADLQGADLRRTQLADADLRGAVFSASTDFTDVKLGDGRGNSVCMADVRWGGANLAVVDWRQLTVRGSQLGDEREAHSWKPKYFIPPQDDLPLKEAIADRRAHEKQQRLEAYRAAVRANRQLATALRDQGMNEEADAFAYRAQVVQRSVFAQQGKRGRATLSLFLDLLAGHGYKPARSLYTYLGVLVSFALLFFLAGNGWLTFGLDASQYGNRRGTRRCS